MALPVLIIGSGLGGLTLAHSLEKHGIPYRIFERDGARDQRAQGYRISIDGGGAAGADGLKAALSPELFARFEETSAEERPVGGRIDGPSGKLIRGGVVGLLSTGGWGMLWALGSRYLGRKWSASTWTDCSLWIGRMLYLIPTPHNSLVPSAPSKDYKIDRRVLRSVLLDGQSSKITYDAAFTHYDISRDAVTAHFADGTSAEGSLLVGADGVSSRVAKQLTGNATEPIDLGYRLIYGKTPLTIDVEKALHPILAQRGASFVTQELADSRILMVVEVIRFNHDHAPQNYIFWALCAKSGILLPETASLPSMQGAAAADIARSATTTWDPRIKVVFDAQDDSQTAILRMTTSDTDHTVVWKTEPLVTVLGDAIHCMPPTGGQGANSAMWDAALLGATLAASGENGPWSEKVIRSYEDAMREHIGDIVGLACIGAAKIIG